MDAQSWAVHVPMHGELAAPLHPHSFSRYFSNTANWDGYMLMHSPLQPPAAPPAPPVPVVVLAVPVVLVVVVVEVVDVVDVVDVVVDVVPVVLVWLLVPPVPPVLPVLLEEPQAAASDTQPMAARSRS